MVRDFACGLLFGSRLIHARKSAQLVRDHSLDFWRVGRTHQSIGIKVAFALGVLRGKDVALERFTALDLAGRGLLKAFSGAFVCFQFRHIP